MARHDLAQRRSEGLDAFKTVERQLRLQQVRIALRGSDVVVENPLLQRCQRVDVLHIGGATRNAGDDPLDVHLLQLYQRQHRRRDVRAIGGDAVGRHFDFPTAADRSGQCSERRLAEQHAHVAAQIELTHAFDQHHRQQRMPTQLEEVIVTPDPLHLQDFGPDLRQGDFDLASRCLVFAANQILCPGAGSALRSTLPLAVSGSAGRRT